MTGFSMRNWLGNGYNVGRRSWCYLTTLNLFSKYMLISSFITIYTELVPSLFARIFVCCYVDAHRDVNLLNASISIPVPRLLSCRFINQLAQCSPTSFLDFLPVSPDEDCLTFIICVLQMPDRMEASLRHRDPFDSEWLSRWPYEYFLPLGGGDVWRWQRLHACITLKRSATIHGKYQDHVTARIKGLC